jgi:CDP-paratose 2-epimerase
MANTILVTGGAGFVGSSIAIALRERDAARRIVAFDNLRRRGSELNLPRLQAAGVTFVHGDVRAAADFRAVGDAEVLIECSGETSVLAGYDGSPEYVIESNLGGAIHGLEYARTRGAAVVFLSTSRVYPIAALQSLRLRDTETRFELETEQSLPGAGREGISEDFPLEGARSLYGATKRCAELLFEEFAAAYGVRAVINRCGLIAGPGQMGKTDQGVVTLWVARHVYRRPLPYIGFGGSGKQVRDVLHVDDLARLILLELENLPRIAGRVFNVGGGASRAVSLLELTELCRCVTGNSTEVHGDPAPRPADVPVYISDCRRIEAALGWSPQRSVEETASDIHSWILGNQSALEHVLE